MEHRLKMYLNAILTSNGNLGGIIARYREEVTYPTCRQLMAEIVVRELLDRVKCADLSEISPDDLKEFACENRALLKFLGETGAGGVQEELLEYCASIKGVPGFADIWILACRTAGKCQVRELSAHPPY